MNNFNKVAIETWGLTQNNDEVYRYTISGDKLTASFISLGATIQRLVYDGKDIIFTLPDVKIYEKFSGGCMGATVGRYAGRIAKGRFEIDGEVYQLNCNQNENHLHGGQHGFNTKIWDSEPFESENEAGVIFRMISPDGDENYPGNLSVSVKFTVTCDDCIKISYRAQTDKPTIINLTNHCYFNLHGLYIGESGFPTSDGDNSDVELMIDAGYITEQVDSIPTGKLTDVTETHFDFREPRIISEVKEFDGYDHNFVLNNPSLDKPSATAFSRKSGILMECFTDQPAIQFFSLGNPGSSLALETQHFPDSPNHPEFPNTILRPDEVFESTTIYKFTQR